MNFSISLLPLVLQRRGRDDQHAFDAGGAGEDLGGGDGLDRLAQAHVVGEQAAAGLGGEQGPFALIRIELGLDELVERRALAEGLVDPPRQARPVADLGDERHGVVVAADLVPGGRRLLQKLVEVGEGGFQEPALGVEVPPGERLEVPRGTRCRAERSPRAGPRTADRPREYGGWKPSARAVLPPGCFASRASANSTCLQVPSVLTAKSGQEQ